MAYTMAFWSCVLALIVLALLPRAHADVAGCNTTLVQAVRSRPELSLFSGLIDSSDLEDRLSSTDNVTVLAPNNNAFNGTNGLLSLLTKNGLTLDQITGGGNNRVGSIILYHIILTPATTAQLAEGQKLPTALQGSPELVVDKNTSTAGTTVSFRGPANNATVLTADIRVCKSVMHIINRVLLPNANLSAIPVFNEDVPTPGLGNANAASSLAIGAWAFAVSGALATALVM